MAGNRLLWLQQTDCIWVARRIVYVLFLAVHCYLCLLQTARLLLDILSFRCIACSSYIIRTITTEGLIYLYANFSSQTVYFCCTVVSSESLKQGCGKRERLLVLDFCISLPWDDPDALRALWRCLWFHPLSSESWVLLSPINFISAHTRETRRMYQNIGTTCFSALFRHTLYSYFLP